MIVKLSFPDQLTTVGHLQGKHYRTAIRLYLFYVKGIDSFTYSFIIYWRFECPIVHVKILF